MNSWGAHLCWRDPQCQEYGAPRRLYVETPWGTLILAVHRDDWTQLWLPFKTRQPWTKEPDGRSHWSRWFSPVVWAPAKKASRP